MSGLDQRVSWLPSLTRRDLNVRGRRGFGNETMVNYSRWRQSQNSALQIRQLENLEIIAIRHIVIHSSDGVVRM
jgi:hypothetical protein